MEIKLDWPIHCPTWHFATCTYMTLMCRMAHAIIMQCKSSEWTVKYSFLIQMYVAFFILHANIFFTLASELHVWKGTDTENFDWNKDITFPLSWIAYISSLILSISQWILLHVHVVYKHIIVTLWNSIQIQFKYAQNKKSFFFDNRGLHLVYKCINFVFEFWCWKPKS